MSREQLAFSFDEPGTPQPYTLTCADVLAWAQSYTGPKFHAMLCDPPYHLTSGNMGVDWDSFGHSPTGVHSSITNKSARKGFMGKTWDGNDISFQPDTWKALAQHLLPGAFIMAFASSRGFHRVMTAMEDAGLRLYPAIFGWANGSSFPKATRIDAVLEKQRHDYPAVKQVVLWLREAAAQAGYTAERINDALGWGSAVAHHFLAPSESNAGVPTWEQWLQLKSLLKLSDELDAEVWRLNGRKGQPGEIWAQREVIGVPDRYCAGRKSAIWGADEHQLVTAPATPLAQTWAGHRYGGQMLKNSLEPIIVAQVPYPGKPVQSITSTGAGALNIDGARISTGDVLETGRNGRHTLSWKQSSVLSDAARQYHRTGRWPPNFAISHLDTCVQVGTRQVRGAGWDDTEYGPKRMLRGNIVKSVTGHYADANGLEEVAAWECADGCPVAALDAQAGVRTSGGAIGHRQAATGQTWNGENCGLRQDRIGTIGYDDGSQVSRFFHVSDWSLDVAEQLAQADPVRYCPKASRGERDAGLEGMPRQYNDWQRETSGLSQGKNPSTGERSGNRCTPAHNHHPTVKPLALCRWLATLLLPPDAYAPRRLLNVFAGTGSEAIGALLAGWDEVVLVEQDASYVALAEQRLAYWSRRTAGGV